jgi:hydrogenase maturation protease
MSPDAVLALLDTLCAGTGAVPPRRTLVVGCEPATVEEGIGLSPPVADAVSGAVRMVGELIRDEAVVRPAHHVVRPSPVGRREHLPPPGEQP